MAGALARTGGLAPGRSAPFVIAHAGGNNPWRVKDAIEAGADLVEVDLWARRGAFEARHERRFGPLPLLFEKWYLRRPDGPFQLAELLTATGDHARLFIDLKNAGGEPVRLLKEALAAARPAVLPVASSQIWSLLRKLRTTLPQVPVFYSIDVRAQLDLFLRIMKHERPPDGVSCRHTLLDKATIQAMRERGITVVAWTVDDPERAVDLVEAGVQAITTHEIRAIRAALAGRR